MEYFDIVDHYGNPTGDIIERGEAHRKGVAHRTSHVWIVRRKQDKVQVLLQKRCMTKDSYPGCYDISSAGHIPNGSEYDESAIRELSEELGVDIEPKQLIECGILRIRCDEEFHGEIFHDKQIAKVFLLWLDWDEDKFVVQKEEIDEVRWFDFSDCKKAVIENSIPNCILLDELKLLEKNF